MGQLLGSLTNQGSMLSDANTGQPIYMGSPKDVLAKTGPMVAQSTGVNPNNPLDMSPNIGPLPKITKPSFEQAATYGATPGGANATSPGLTKAGKLVTLLTQGLQGAMAGRAAQEQATVQSGGRRSGGAGMGFEAGYMLPWQRAQAAQQYQLGQAALTPVETPYGEMPAEYAAKTVLPAFIRAGGAEQVAQTKAGADIQGKQIQAQSAQNVAGINKRFMAVPGVGLYDTQTRQVIPGTQQGIVITPDIAQDYGLPASFVGKPMTLSGFSSLENAQRFNEQPVEGEAGPALVNRNPASPKFGTVTPLGLGNPSLGRAVQVGDVNNPGQTKYSTAGQAIASGAPGAQSASVQVPKTAMRSEVPTKIGDLKLAFTTAMQHADLLQQALGALQNGDTRALNSLKNTFATQFGSAAPTNFQAIANAYTREITKMLASGHLTDAEIGSAGATIPQNASPQQVMGALNAYRSLAQSKMNMLNQQKSNAIQQSQPQPKVGDYVKQGGRTYRVTKVDKNGKVLEAQ